MLKGGDLAPAIQPVNANAEEIEKLERTKGVSVELTKASVPSSLASDPFFLQAKQRKTANPMKAFILKKILIFWYRSVGSELEVRELKPYKSMR